MKENILIIGFGDIGQRVVTNLNSKNYNFVTVNRSYNSNKTEITHISWDWLSKENLKLPFKNFKRIIFIPKPSEITEEGYKNGFNKSIKNIMVSLNDITYESFIAISSTRIFGSNQFGILDEASLPKPDCFRGKIILEYEAFLKKNILNNLSILRFGGLYLSGTKIPEFNNKLDRDHASQIICFFIENTFEGIFNCTENKILNPHARSVSGEKINNTNFIMSSND